MDDQKYIAKFRADIDEESTHIYISIHEGAKDVLERFDYDKFEGTDVIKNLQLIEIMLAPPIKEIQKHKYVHFNKFNYDLPFQILNLIFTRSLSNPELIKSIKT